MKKQDLYTERIKYWMGEKAMSVEEADTMTLEWENKLQSAGVPKSSIQDIVIDRTSTSSIPKIDIMLDNLAVRYSNKTKKYGVSIYTYESGGQMDTMKFRQQLDYADIVSNLLNKAMTAGEI